MGKLKNTSINNTYGEGKEQIYISDSGKKYRIKNASTDNVFGEGKEKIIYEDGKGCGDDLAELLVDVVPWWGWVIFFGFCYLMQKILF